MPRNRNFRVGGGKEVEDGGDTCIPKADLSWYTAETLVAQMVKIRLQFGRPGFRPWVGKISCRTACNLLQYSCLENPLGQRGLVGYSSWGCKESTRLSNCTQYNTAWQKPAQYCKTIILQLKMKKLIKIEKRSRNLFKITIGERGEFPTRAEAHPCASYQ